MPAFNISTSRVGQKKLFIRYFQDIMQVHIPISAFQQVLKFWFGQESLKCKTKVRLKDDEK